MVVPIIRIENRRLREGKQFDQGNTANRYQGSTSNSDSLITKSHSNLDHSVKTSNSGLATGHLLLISSPSKIFSTLHQKSFKKHKILSFLLCTQNLSIVSPFSYSEIRSLTQSKNYFYNKLCCAKTQTHTHYIFKKLFSV